MPPFLPWPGAPSTLLRNARLATPSGLHDTDLLVAGDRIAAIGRALPTPAVAPAAAELDLAHAIVLPGLVDLHTHLDKGHTWHRAPNPDGTHAGAIAAVARDRAAHWTADDVHARATFSLQAAHAHGTVALRTHLDSAAPQHAISWPVFDRLRAEWAGRIALQAVALVGLDAYATPFAETLADTVAAAGGLLGGSGALEPAAPALIRRLFDLAVDRDLDIDLHTDETGDPAARTLRLVADEALRRRWLGRVTCGHCCSLAAQPAPEAADTIARVAAAGITIVTLPLANLYLQGRRPRGGTPLWRGLTLIHELRAAGVRVVVASDNTRDAFHPWGDLDVLEAFRTAVRAGHLDQPVEAWLDTVTTLPAASMGLPGPGLVPGAAADLVILPARDSSELLARPHADRLVLRAGQPAPPPPPYIGRQAFTRLP